MQADKAAHHLDISCHAMVMLTSKQNYAGTASGGLFALQCPDLQNYSHARGHKHPTLDAVAVREGVVSASAALIRFHTVGSVPKLTITAKQVQQQMIAPVATVQMLQHPSACCCAGCMRYTCLLSHTPPLAQSHQACRDRDKVFADLSIE